MRLTKYSKIRNWTVALVLFVGLATPASLKAEFECTSENVAGTYMFVAKGEAFGVDTLPVSSPRAGVGTFTMDARGKATKFVGNFIDEGGIDPLSNIDLTQVFDIEWTVEPDCTALTTYADRATGQVVLQWPSVFANGGREGWMLWTVPANRRAILSFRRISNIAETDKLEAILRLIASRLSIPRAFLP